MIYLNEQPNEWPGGASTPRTVAAKGLVSMQGYDTPNNKRNKFVRSSPTQIEVNCSYCGRAMFYRPSKAANHRRFYCDAKHQDADTATVAERIEGKYIKRESGCWEWIASRNDLGYGRIFSGSKSEGNIPAHRAMYELHVGPIPEGLHLDHLCRNPSCVNPDHLEPVTPQENILRGMAPCAIGIRTGQCSHGHEYTPENTYVRKNGHRVCRECRRIQARRRKQRLQEKGAA